MLSVYHKLEIGLFIFFLPYLRDKEHHVNGFYLPYFDHVP